MKTCGICKKRPIGSGKGQKYNDTVDAKNHGFCVPCLELAYDENSHSDEGHEEPSIRTEELTKDCWVCHPELDLSKADHTPRTGTSRLGIVFHVNGRTSPKSKAEQALSQIEGAKSFTIRRVKKSGLTVLAVELETGLLSLAWDDSGRYAYGSTAWTADGKSRKVRNVAQALRLARGEKN